MVFVFRFIVTLATLISATAFTLQHGTRVETRIEGLSISHESRWKLSRQCSSSRNMPTTTVVLFAENDVHGEANDLTTGGDDETSSRAMELGFDKRQQQQQQQSELDSLNQSSSVQQERLKRSLDDSAKFKIRNDARFTWLAFFLVSAAYAYSCFSPELGYLELLGLPDGGLLGGAVGSLFALTSLVLFFLPEIFGKKQ